MRKRGKFSLSLRGREAMLGYMFIMPWLIGFIVFFLANYLHTLRMSVSSVDMVAAGGYDLSFSGLENFRHIFTEHATFTRVFVESMLGILVDIPLIIFFSLFIALLLNRKFKMRGIVRAVFFLPVIMASAAITNAIEQSLLMVMGGLTTMPPEMQQTTGLSVQSIAVLLANFGLPLQIIQYIIGAVARVYEIVRASGVQILIFLAALQSVPTSLYEVAFIEGSTPYEAFWKITLPIISPLIVTNVVYTVVDRYVTSAVVDMAYESAFLHWSFGVSAAMSVVSSVAVLLLLLMVCGFISKFAFYHT
ncbi:MAG: sugar ABC transporter permease [Defluviitaleaceae bacterium]|nr:sugar ABC transporter permease [Defluviitaleaceae bacterium]